jgi:hypothetical protein
MAWEVTNFATRTDNIVKLSIEENQCAGSKPNDDKAWQIFEPGYQLDLTSLWPFPVGPSQPFFKRARLNPKILPRSILILVHGSIANPFLWRFGDPLHHLPYVLSVPFAHSRRDCVSPLVDG